MTATGAGATLLVETRGAVRLLTLNRPEKLNAMDTAMIESLVAALQGADADDAIGGRKSRDPLVPFQLAKPLGALRHAPILGVDWL